MSLGRKAGPVPVGAGQQQRRVLPPALYRLEPAAVWANLRQQPVAFWLLCTYLFFEYVRPQQIYESIAGFPFALLMLILTTGAVALGRMRLRSWHLGDSLMVGMSVLILASSILAWRPSDSFKAFDAFFSWVLVYFLITTIVTSADRMWLFLLAYLLYNIKMTQHGVRQWHGVGFGFAGGGATCAPGWFQNSGECGAQMDMLFPVGFFFFLAARAWWGKITRWGFFAALPLGAVLTIVASSSRGALMALAGIALWFALKHPKRVRMLVAVAVAGALVWAIVPEGFRERFQTMGTDRNSIKRLEYWRDGWTILNQHPLFGIGYDNWLDFYRTTINDWGQVPHNIFVQSSAETGYIGLIGFVALILGTFLINARTRALAPGVPQLGEWFRNMAHAFDAALVGYLIAGSFVTILYYPFFWINLAFTVALNVSAQNEVQRATMQLLRRPARVAWSRPAESGGARVLGVGLSAGGDAPP